MARNELFVKVSIRCMTLMMLAEISLISDTMRHVLIRRIKETRSTRKANKLVKGPEPRAMRHHVGCVHKHLNHGTEEKQTRTTRAR